jgi:hypothetical protein
MWSVLFALVVITIGLIYSIKIISGDFQNTPS